VVDDVPELRSLFTTALRRSGFDTLEAANGPDALRVLSAHPVGLVVLDVSMPGMSGLEVVAAMRRELDTATVPVLLVTGRANQEDIVEGLEAGADDFLSKPVRIDELIARVRAHMRSRTTWTRILHDELQARAGVVAALGRLNVSGEPDEAAEAVVRELGRHTGSPFAAVFQVAEGRPPQALATFTRRLGARRGGARLSKRAENHLLARLLDGPWAQGLTRGDTGDPLAEFARAGLGALAAAPIYANQRVVGLFLIGLGGEGEPLPPTRQATLLAASIDYASMLSAVAGHAIMDRHRAAATRASLRRVLDLAEFYPVFQPIVEIAERTVIGYEALTRFRDGTLPDVRFAEAAGLGLGFEYEAAAIEAALAGARRLPDDSIITLNASPGFVLEGSRLSRLIDSYGRPVVLELTEHTRIDDYGALRGAIGDLDDRTRVAVDDAGAGDASLRHILELKPAFAKLDISIVRGIQEDAVRQALVAGLGYFAAKSDCRLIAEGVETPEEAATLQELGVTLAQGYLFGRPAPFDTAA